MVRVHGTLKDEKEEVQEGEIVETEWDLKKIVIGIFILSLLFILGSYVFLGSPEDARNSRGTLGVSSENLSPTPELPDREDIQNVITNAKDALSQITAENLTSSQAAIQKVISDLQGLSGSGSAATNLFCSLVCKK